MPMNIAPPSGDIPQDLLDAANATDAAVGDELAGLITLQSPANPKVLNALSDALAKFAGIMGMQVAPEKYTAPTVDLDPDMVRLLSMAEAAGADYGKPFPVALADVTDEGALTAITAHIAGLNGDKEFAAWLESPGEGEGEGETEAPEVEIKVEAPMGGPMNGGPMATDDLFAKRLRR